MGMQHIGRLGLDAAGHNHLLCLVASSTENSRGDKDLLAQWREEMAWRKISRQN